MKKKTIYAILAAATAMLLCSACGGQTGNQETALDTVENDSLEMDSAYSDESPGEEEPHSTDEVTSDQDTADERQSYYVTLDWQTIENNNTAEDGTLLYTSFCTYPVVSIEENQAAADNINASIQEYVTAFTSDTSVQSSARENYVPENTGFITYYCNLSFAACRSDSNVISFTALFDVYSGGPHGNYGLVGVNYDTRTGEHIRFAELGEDAVSFRADTFTFIRTLADSAPYQRQMYDLYDHPSDEQLEAVLYAEDKWYLSPGGLVFISNPYELGPYAAGEIEFTVPYHELDKMGFKKDYQYNGNLTVELQEEIPVSMDLNGDGKEETILTDYVYDGRPEAEAEYIQYLLINDIDVANRNDELSGLLADFPWSQCVLYDINPSDDMIEFAVITIAYPNDSDDVLLTSHFFRYEKDGSVSFLGIMDGSILDPAAVLSITTPQHVSLDWQKLEREESSEDGMIYYTSDCIYPVVSIEGNQTAADKINTDIQDRVNSFWNSYTTEAEFAREYYEQSGGGFGGLDNLTYQAARSDDYVISFLITYYGYEGGAAHGNYGSIGVNYDARTGEPIDFSELAQDSGQFYTDTFAFNRELAATEAYQEILMPEDMPAERLESVLYQKDAWVLAADGLTFISSPYALASFAAGTITFVIPYDELDKMGMKPEYQYSGNLTVTLWDKYVYSIDVNGDDLKESIQFYDGYEKDAHGNSTYGRHLIINGTDILQEELRRGNETLDKMFTESYWTICALYDLNPFDDTVEIVFMTASGDHDEGEIPAFTSHLFRCEKDGLTYIGRMNGTVSVLGTL
ncbi:MAG: DUF4163 domain-containing protein [Lachnospiraceae bacterium]|nr:DUF4163 domain-containing protein [Lachnospiraceae bacterium]